MFSLAVVAVLASASMAHADSFQLTFSGNGVSGVLNLAATSEGGGVYLVTSATGWETVGITKSQVTGLVQPDGLGIYLPGLVIYDDLIYTSSPQALDIFGLLFFVQGSSQPVHLYDPFFGFSTVQHHVAFAVQATCGTLWVMTHLAQWQWFTVPI